MGISFAMPAPEHHFLVPAVLLAAYYNIKGDPEQKKRKIKAARERSSNILVGFCGFHGDCGPAVGTGIFQRSSVGSTVPNMNVEAPTLQLH